MATETQENVGPRLSRIHRDRRFSCDHREVNRIGRDTLTLTSGGVERTGHNPVVGVHHSQHGRGGDLDNIACGVSGDALQAPSQNSPATLQGPCATVGWPAGQKWPAGLFPVTTLRGGDSNVHMPALAHRGCARIPQPHGWTWSRKTSA